jgi:hypothetical protein
MTEIPGKEIEMERLVPTLARGAVRVEGSVQGQTRLTLAKPETSDDEMSFRVAREHPVPTIATRAVVVVGELRGYTIFTKAGAETSDDQGRPPDPR